jgi:hypothetical protein
MEQKICCKNCNKQHNCIYACRGDCFFDNTCINCLDYVQKELLCNKCVHNNVCQYIHETIITCKHFIQKTELTNFEKDISVGWG